MEEHVSQLTLWFNHIFAPIALRLLHALHIQPKDYDAPIPEYVVMSLFVLLLCTILALILRARLSVERPGALQQGAELLLTNPLGFGIKDLLEENVAHGGDKFIAFTGSVAIFILFANLLSLFPAFSSPTGNAVVPLACACLTFLYFNWQGIRHHGPFYYLLTFAGSPKQIGDWVLAVLLFPVELISTSARLLSLTVRLWANIFARRSGAGTRAPFWVSLWDFFRLCSRFSSLACTSSYPSSRHTSLRCCPLFISGLPQPTSTET
jgi:F-type H+-transporting ATPase subunit a